MPVPRPPIRDPEPVDKAGFFSALWQRFFYGVEQETNLSQVHRADMDNPHRSPTVPMFMGDESGGGDDLGMSIVMITPAPVKSGPPTQSPVSLGHPAPMFLGEEQTEEQNFIMPDRTIRVWNDMRLPGTSARLGSSNPTLTAFLGAGGLMTLNFNGVGSTMNQVFFEIQMSHEYLEGTDILPHVHWCPTTADAGNVVWQLEYSWVDIGGTFGAAATIAATAAAAGGTAWVHHMTSLPTITGTGKHISSMLVCRLFRDPADSGDDYTHDAAFLEFDLHYQIDALGSRQASDK